MQPGANCGGSHHFYVADVALVPAEGKVCVITVCTSCGETHCKPFKVARDHSGLLLKSDEDKENEKQ